MVAENPLRTLKVERWGVGPGPIPQAVRQFVRWAPTPTVATGPLQPRGRAKSISL